MKNTTQNWPHLRLLQEQRRKKYISEIKVQALVGCSAHVVHQMDSVSDPFVKMECACVSGGSENVCCDLFLHVHNIG